jgi:hypothetical protein
MLRESPSAVWSVRFQVTRSTNRALSVIVALMSISPSWTGPFRYLALVIFLLYLGTSSALAEEPKLFVFWNTVSPDGKYALAWSTTGAATRDDLLPPDVIVDNPVSNYVIEVASRKIVLKLPEAHFWELYGDSRPSRYSLETAWSDDSRSLLAIYEAWWSCDYVFLVDVSVPRAVSIAEQMKAAFGAMLESVHGREYIKQKDSYKPSFTSPWFVARDRFFVSAGAEIPHADSHYDYCLYFKTGNGETTAKLVKAELSLSSGEALDRLLNGAYRTLHGLLSSSDQKALVEEERAWLVKRDAIKSEAERKAFIEARISELQNRTDKIIDEKEKE